jgi:hypothetical protein
MSATRKIFRLTIAVALLIVLAACATNDETEGVPAVGETSLPPLGNAPDAALEAQSAPPGSEAFVNSVEVVLLESFPVQAQALIQGTLPDTCSAIDQVNQTRNETAFEIALSTIRQTDAMCTDQRQPFEQTVSLDVAGLPGGTYTVNVTSANSVATTFALALDNVPLQPPPTAELIGASVNGVIWQDQCQINADGSAGAGCVADGAGGYRADGIYDPAEQRLAGVELQLASGECDAGGPVVGTATTDSSGTYLFTGLQAGVYCVFIDPTAPLNAAVLPPGQFTYPENDLARTNLTLAADSFQSADFGWGLQVDGVAIAPGSASSGAESEASCQNAASFVADVTIPDNTPLAPGESFVKTWRVQNSGSCPWSPEYLLTFAEGDQMGGPSAVPLPQMVDPGGEVEISVNLTAPAEAGSYRGDWLLQSPDGTTFGSRGDFAFYVQVVVQN